MSKKKQTTTQTPIVQEPMKGNLNNYAGSVANYANSDAYQYVAPASDLQKLAFDLAPNLGGWQAPQQQALGMAQNAGSAGPATYQAPKLAPAAQAQAAQLSPAAQAEAAPQAQAQSLLTNLSAYMNPYTKDVVDASMADWDAQFGRMDAALQAKGAGAGAFAGSRYGVERGIFGGEALRGRGALNANLRADAFNTGAALAGQDADRRQNTNFFNIGNTQQRNLFDAGQRNQFALTQGGFNQQANMYNTGAQNDFKLAQGTFDNEAARYNAQAGEAALQRALQAAGITANIGSDMGSQARADLGLTADIGSLQREIEQLKLNAPVTQLMNTGTAYGFIPPATYTGQKGVTKSSGSLLDSALAAGMVAAQFSDRRLKSDIAKTGELADGLGVYEWEYRQDAGIDLPKGRFRGVMADEVAELRPWALGPAINGFATVDYGRLGA